MATARLLGSSIKRREDPRFLTGRGNYTDDVQMAGMTHAVFVRSPHANARVRSIDVSRAKAHPGVVAVFTGKDMAGVQSLPCGWLLPELKVPAAYRTAPRHRRRPLRGATPVAVVRRDARGRARRGRPFRGRLGGPGRR